jgi:hypothetical protein
LGDEDTNSIFTKKNIQLMGLLTPKNNKGDKKSGNKAKNNAPASQFFKNSNSKPIGANKKPVKTGGSRGS